MATPSDAELAALTAFDTPTICNALEVVMPETRRGGYTLRRPAGSISVADVIQAIDGPVTVTACSTDEGQCDQYAKCNVRDPLWRVRERILSALGECTIAELAAESPQTAPPAPARAAVLLTHL